jgi:hypothetical protein
MMVMTVCAESHIAFDASQLDPGCQMTTNESGGRAGKRAFHV